MCYLTLVALASILRLRLFATKQASKWMVCTGYHVLDQGIPVIEEDVARLTVLFLVCRWGHVGAFTSGGEIFDDGRFGCENFYARY
jgi:hypothetical protein